MGKKINVEQHGNLPVLSPTDAGITYTLATLANLIVALVFTAVISVIASSKGMDAVEFSKSIQDNFVYNLFSFGLSSLSLLITALAVSFYKKQRPFAPIKITKPDGKYWIIAAMLTFGLLFGFTELNNLFVTLLGKIGYTQEPMSIPNDKWWQLAIWIIVAAVLPAILEETIFRGYILEGLKVYSTPFIVIMGGLLFMLFHQNPQQTPYQFVCGAAFFLLAVRCGSILPCVAMHFTNNLVVLVLDYISGGYISQTATIVLTILGLISFALAFIYLVFIDKKSANNKETPVYPTKKTFFTAAAFGIGVCIIMWVSNFLANGGLN